MGERILRRILAAQDAENIADYIAQDSLEAALRFLKNVEATLQELAEAAGSGNRFSTAQPELAHLLYKRVTSEGISQSFDLLRSTSSRNRGRADIAWRSRSRRGIEKNLVTTNPTG